jgi:ribosome biogenesis GTPase
VIGFVVAVDRGRYTCMVDGRPVTAMKARELGRGSVVVGDRVSLAGDVSGADGSLARIVRVNERSSVLRRSADDTDPVERAIVANADQMLIVCALASPPPRPRFVDRCLVAAYDAGLSPILVLTKADLGSDVPVRALYEPLDVPMVSTRPGALGALPSLLDGKISVLIGQSGVGKSTLVNTLVPDAVRAVGSVNPVTGRGRHTSSSAVAFPYQSGWLIDTPGLRGFGLGHVSPSRVIEAFGDLAEGVAGCPAGCDHMSADCSLDDWARAHGGTERLDSLRRLLASRAGTDTEQLALAVHTAAAYAALPPLPHHVPLQPGHRTLAIGRARAITAQNGHVMPAFEQCAHGGPGSRTAMSALTGNRCSAIRLGAERASWDESPWGARNVACGAERARAQRSRPGGGHGGWRDRWGRDHWSSSRPGPGPAGSNRARARGRTGSSFHVVYASTAPPLRQ